MTERTVSTQAFFATHCLTWCFGKYLVHCRHLRSFIQQQLNYFYVPHLGGLD